MAISDSIDRMLGPNGILGSVAGMPDMWKHINQEEAMRQLMAQAQAQSQLNVAQAQNANVPVGPSTPQASLLAQRAREMFLKRMGGIRAELRIDAQDFLQCHIYNDTVYLFYCFGGRDGCVRENIDLFPSDQLITQFRMVLSAT